MSNKNPPSTLLCTVGTSLFRANLDKLPSDRHRKLSAAYAGKDWGATAAELRRLSPKDRTCGAEINSIAGLRDKGWIAPDARLLFFHSDTDDGRDTALVLRHYYQGSGPSPEARPVVGLQDQDPRRFRTEGLRNLAKGLCRAARDYGSASCAVNATGGYKAQIAVAVLLGQSLSMPVFYKHELFSEIIAFPPMPVALDFEYWLEVSGLLSLLARETDPVPLKDCAEFASERLESLVERTEIGGKIYVELSPTGQIFHETFRERFRGRRDQMLPPVALKKQKQKPKLEDSGHMRSHPEIMRLMQRVTDEVEQVIQCRTYYYNRDLSSRTLFRLSAKGIEGVFSDGSYTAKFAVDTTAKTEGEQKAVVAALNLWLEESRLL